MVRNGTQKEKLIRSINFGRPGDPARELVEIYERKMGKNKLSKLVREAIIAQLSSSDEYDHFKINILKQERIQLSKELEELGKKMQENASKQEKLGVDINEI